MLSGLVLSYSVGRLPPLVAVFVCVDLVMMGRCDGMA